MELPGVWTLKKWHTVRLYGADDGYEVFVICTWPTVLLKSWKPWSADPVRSIATGLPTDGVSVSVPVSVPDEFVGVKYPWNVVEEPAETVIELPMSVEKSLLVKMADPAASNEPLPAFVTVNVTVSVVYRGTVPASKE
jgi:hypothetical protein